MNNEILNTIESTDTTNIGEKYLANESTNDVKVAYGFNSISVDKNVPVDTRLVAATRHAIYSLAKTAIYVIGAVSIVGISAIIRTNKNITEETENAYDEYAEA